MISLYVYSIYCVIARSWKPFLQSCKSASNLHSLGVLCIGPSGFPLVTGIIIWAIAVLFVVLHFLKVPIPGAMLQVSLVVLDSAILGFPVFLPAPRTRLPC